MTAYEGLANGIIVQAVKDYRAAMRKLKKDPEDDFAASEIRKIERFFRSGWYGELTDIDGEYLIGRLREEAESL